LPHRFCYNAANVKRKKTEASQTEKLPPTPSWHVLTAQAAVEQLESSSARGLSEQAAAERLQCYGPNQLAEIPRPTFLKLVLAQLKGFVVILLIVAAIISLLLREWVDASAILTIVLLNAILGVVQESRAEAALAALKKLAAPEASVLRDGHRRSIPATRLVPGDIVYLEAGNFVPADIRLLESVNLRVEEAALTGESQAVQKDAGLRLEREIPLGDRRNTVFMGTLVSYGRGNGVVTSTGMHTQLGLIARMLQSVKEEQTPLQKRLDQLGRLLGWASLAICLLVFVGFALQSTDLTIITSPQGGLLAYLSQAKEQLVNTFMVAVSLAIAAVPEGLPAVVTISLALGMREMIRRHALIRRLSSVETLGSATVICSDKTGTLTQNEMTVTRLWVDGRSIVLTGAGYDPRGQFLLDGRPLDLQQQRSAAAVLWAGAINNDAVLEEIGQAGEPDHRIVGDPTEGALIVAAVKAGADIGELNRAFPRCSEIPFDSERKRMVTVHAVEHPRASDLSPFDSADSGRHFVVAVKGAPDLVLRLCTRFTPWQGGEPRVMDEDARRSIQAANDEMTRQALRVLAIAYHVLEEKPRSNERSELESGLVFAGLVGMTDPARPEVSPAMARASRAGIRTIMITGDYPNTARAVAEDIGLLQPGHGVLTGSELDRISDADLRERIDSIDVFARVSPQHKMRIVEALKADGEVVAMTGDGVNDAPAIKRADIGVAMGITGTDVAKETADMVLTDDNYVSIVSAVEQGRIIYSNIRKFVYYLISCNLGEILIVFLPTVLGHWLFPVAAARGVFSPLTAIQLLWLNLVTDGAPALALGMEKGEPDIMDRKPRPPGEPIINGTMWVNVAIQAVTIAATTLAAFLIGLRHTQPQYAETLAFVTLSLSEVFRAFTSRSERASIFRIGPFSNRWMNLAGLSSLALILVVVYVPGLNTVFNTLPMGLTEWELVLPLVLVPSVVAELTKLAFRLFKKR
jgi:Ca2+-transporting ATPase